MKNNDEKAMMMLEKAVSKAEESLKENNSFQPFLLLMDKKENILVFENDIENSTKSYSELEEIAREKAKDTEILVLAVETSMPEQFHTKTPNSIRLHLEERHLIKEPLSARFIFIPFVILKDKEENSHIKLDHPVPVSFPPEFIVE